jgi:hypothetical protein
LTGYGRRRAVHRRGNVSNGRKTVNFDLLLHLVKADHHRRGVSRTSRGSRNASGTVAVARQVFISRHGREAVEQVDKLICGWLLLERALNDGLVELTKVERGSIIEQPYTNIVLKARRRGEAHKREEHQLPALSSALLAWVFGQLLDDLAECLIAKESMLDTLLYEIMEEHDRVRQAAVTHPSKNILEHTDGQSRILLLHLGQGGRDRVFGPLKHRITELIFTEDLAGGKLLRGAEDCGVLKTKLGGKALQLEALEGDLKDLDSLSITISNGSLDLLLAELLIIKGKHGVKLLKLGTTPIDQIGFGAEHTELKRPTRNSISKVMSFEKMSVKYEYVRSHGLACARWPW